MARSSPRSWSTNGFSPSRHFSHRRVPSRRSRPADVLEAVRAGLDQDAREGHVPELDPRAGVAAAGRRRRAHRLGMHEPLGTGQPALGVDSRAPVGRGREELRDRVRGREPAGPQDRELPTRRPSGGCVSPQAVPPSTSRNVRSFAGPRLYAQTGRPRLLRPLRQGRGGGSRRPQHRRPRLGPRFLAVP